MTHMRIEDCGLRIEEKLRSTMLPVFLNPQFSILNPVEGGRA
jgi:hypothetical protein